MKKIFQKQVTKYLLLLLLSFYCKAANSQNFFTTFFLGGSNYSGDLGSPKFPLSNSHPAGGLGFLYELNNRMGVRMDATFGKISGADKDGGSNKSRNLSFISDISEISIGFDYTLFDLYDYKVSPYFFAGVARFGFNPYTKDKNGNVVFLAELDTEGEGFYKDRKPYKTKQTAIPFGGGLMWAIDDNHRIGIELGIRKTFTDYLDDVSTTYVDGNLLASKRGGTAAAIAYRGDELPGGLPYPADGAKRGNPKNKDWYYFTGISYRMRLVPPHSRRQNNDGSRIRRSKISCPRIF
ncbi:MAG: DUF6089 family protein [Ferruginibacter sp.]